jgi:hypothetical protein
VTGGGTAGVSQGGSGGADPGISLVGTTWIMQSSCSACCLGQYTFQAGGVLVQQVCSGTGSHAWTQSGSTVTFTLNDAYVTYTGTISAGVITGTAVNKAGTTWTFRMVLMG